MFKGSWRLQVGGRWLVWLVVAAWLGVVGCCWAWSWQAVARCGWSWQVVGCGWAWLAVARYGRLQVVAGWLGLLVRCGLVGGGCLVGSAWLWLAVVGLWLPRRDPVAGLGSFLGSALSHPSDYTHRLPIDLGPSNNLVLRPPTTSKVSSRVFH